MIYKKLLSVIVCIITMPIILGTVFNSTSDDLHAKSQDGKVVISAILGNGKTKDWRIDHYPSYSKTNTFSFKTEDGKEIVIGDGYIIEIDLKRFITGD